MLRPTFVSSFINSTWSVLYNWPGLSRILLKRIVEEKEEEWRRQRNLIKKQFSLMNSKDGMLFHYLNECFNVASKASCYRPVVNLIKILQS